jgi:superfamily I DNA and/or RNA helicase
VVRSLEIGFLKNLRRTNVMLTRCKRGMFVISSQKFLTGPGAKSLVGEMAKEIGLKGWLGVEEIEAGEFLT